MTIALHERTDAHDRLGVKIRPKRTKSQWLAARLLTLRFLPWLRSVGMDGRSRECICSVQRVYAPRPIKIPCAIDPRKAREAGVFDVRSSVVPNHLILYDAYATGRQLKSGPDHVQQDQARSAIHTCHRRSKTRLASSGRLRSAAAGRWWRSTETPASVAPRAEISAQGLTRCSRTPAGGVSMW
jgi:hypothetical protein